MNTFDAIFLCCNESFNGRLEITQNELIFEKSNGDLVKIDFIDHFCVYHEDRSKFTDRKDRYTLNIITKQLKRYDFCFFSKIDSDNCVKHIQKNFINFKRHPLNNEEFSAEFLENIDFSDVNEPSFWRISTINLNNNFCETLPENVVVADCVSDQSIIDSKKSHLYGRFPIINYIYKKNESCLMTASSVITNLITNQPHRCHADEAMIAHLCQDIPEKDVHIIQITTLPHSTSNQIPNSKEKNFVTQNVIGTNLLNSWLMWSGYNASTINVLPITQLPLCLGHILISLNILPPKYYSSNTSYGLTTDNSSSFWLNSIYMCVSKACMFAKQMVNTQSIFLIMEETGVDYVIVISSLCQILMESKCRTIDGFLGLIYREWFHNGHPFDIRHTCILPKNNSRQNYSQNGVQAIDCSAPVFFLYLNCVRTIIQKYSRYFEFNESLLLHLFKYSYECKLGNNEKSRNDDSINVKNCHFWNFERHLFINQLYIEHTDPVIGKFWPHEMELWDTIFLQSNSFPFASSSSQVFIQKVNQLKVDIYS